MDSGLGDAFGSQFPGGFGFAMATLRPGQIRFDNGSLTFPSAVFVPEPGTLALLGAAGMLACCRRLRRRALGKENPWKGEFSC